MLVLIGLKHREPSPSMNRRTNHIWLEFIIGILGQTFAASAYCLYHLNSLSGLIAVTSVCVGLFSFLKSALAIVEMYHGWRANRSQ